MAVSFDLPTDIEEQLRKTFPDLDDAAKQALAVDAYCAGKLSLGQFAQMLGISKYEADGVLKRRGIMLDIPKVEFRDEVDSLRQLVRK